MAKVFISQFSSLNFSKGWQQDFQQEECYVQSFSQTDIIRVQVTSALSLDYTLINLETNEKTKLTPSIGNVQDLLLPNLEIGIYQLNISYSNNLIASSVFAIKDNACLHNTVLFRYSNNENRFNANFLDDEESIFFEYRVEGGFINKDTTLGVDDSDFRDQDYSLQMLDAYPYSTYTLTIGLADGVPNWVGEKVNLIMSISDTLINGEEWVRSSGSAPELEEVKDYYPLFVFKVDLEKANVYGEEYHLIFKVLGSEDNKAITTEDKQLMSLTVQ